MLHLVRTTINLPDSLLHAAKQRAAAEGRTLTSLIAEGLRSVLHGGAPAAAAGPLPAYGSSTDRPRVDLRDREALWAALDADGPR